MITDDIRRAAQALAENPHDEKAREVMWAALERSRESSVIERLLERVNRLERVIGSSHHGNALRSRAVGDGKRALLPGVYIEGAEEVEYVRNEDGFVVEARRTTRYGHGAERYGRAQVLLTARQQAISDRRFEEFVAEHVRERMRNEARQRIASLEPGSIIYAEVVDDTRGGLTVSASRPPGASHQINVRHLMAHGDRVEIELKGPVQIHFEWRDDDEENGEGEVRAWGVSCMDDDTSCAVHTSVNFMQGYVGSMRLSRNESEALHARGWFGLEFEEGVQTSITVRRLDAS